MGDRSHTLSDFRSLSFPVLHLTMPNTETVDTLRPVTFNRGGLSVYDVFVAGRCPDFA